MSADDLAGAGADLGHEVARRLRLPGPPRGRPSRIGSLASASTRFAAGLARPVPLRRLLRGPDAAAVHSIRDAGTAPPRWWYPVSRPRPEWSAAVRPSALPRRGLPRAVHRIPDEQSWTPGGIAERLVSTAAPVRRFDAVQAAGPMLTSHDRAKLDAAAAARRAAAATAASAPPGAVPVSTPTAARSSTGSTLPSSTRASAATRAPAPPPVTPVRRGPTSGAAGDAPPTATRPSRAAVPTAPTAAPAVAPTASAMPTSTSTTPSGSPPVATTATTTTVTTVVPDVPVASVPDRASTPSAASLAPAPDRPVWLPPRSTRFVPPNPLHGAAAGTSPSLASSVGLGTGLPIAASSPAAPPLPRATALRTIGRLAGPAISGAAIGPLPHTAADHTVRRMVAGGQRLHPALRITDARTRMHAVPLPAHMPIGQSIAARHSAARTGTTSPVAGSATALDPPGAAATIAPASRLATSVGVPTAVRPSVAVANLPAAAAAAHPTVVRRRMSAAPLAMSDLITAARPARHGAAPGRIDRPLATAFGSAEEIRPAGAAPRQPTAAPRHTGAAAARRATAAPHATGAAPRPTGAAPGYVPMTQAEPVRRWTRTAHDQIRTTPGTAARTPPGTTARTLPGAAARTLLGATPLAAAASASAATAVHHLPAPPPISLRSTPARAPATTTASPPPSVPAAARVTPLVQAPDGTLRRSLIDTTAELFRTQAGVPDDPRPDELRGESMGLDQPRLHVVPAPSGTTENETTRNEPADDTAAAILDDPLRLDELVDKVVDRIEERVVDELERRGRRYDPGAF